MRGRERERERERESKTKSDIRGKEPYVVFDIHSGGITLHKIANHLEVTIKSC